MATYPDKKRWRQYGEHLPLSSLKMQLQGDNNYISKENIPTYPRPELHVSHISHSTDHIGTRGILRDGGFRVPLNRRHMDSSHMDSSHMDSSHMDSSHMDSSHMDSSHMDSSHMVWFSLTLTPNELEEAETRPMKLVHPGGEEQELRPITRTRRGWWNGLLRAKLPDGGKLQDFATSPAFSSRSRYGSYRFTFSLSHVLQKYSEQFCDEEKPDLRVYKTVVYKQEVMYAVLVHSPKQRKKFRHLPLLEDTPHCICAFREEPEPHFIWRPQAMSETHRFGLIEESGQLFVENGYKEFYLWDHVALALHVDNEVELITSSLTSLTAELITIMFFKVLWFEENVLKESMRYCNRDKVTVPLNGRPRPFHEHVGQAKDWVGHYIHKFNRSRFHINH